MDAEIVGNVLGKLLGGGIAAFILLGLGLFILIGRNRAVKAFLGMPVTPLAQARVGSVVKVRGVARPGSTPVHVSPITGRPALMYLLHAVHGIENETHSLLERQRGELWLDDGSGVVARVVSGGCMVLLVDDWLLHSEYVMHAIGARIIGRLDERQLAWVYAKLGQKVNVFRVEEARVEPNQVVHVAGRLRSDALGLLFESQGGDQIALIDDDQARVRAREAKQTVAGWLLLVLGVLIGGGCLVWAVLDFV